MPDARFSHGLPWLKVMGNQVVSAATEQPVSLRGVNRSGLEYSALEGRRFIDVAGISPAEIQQIVVEWRANVIRLPFNQDWALNGRLGHSAEEYLADLDQVIDWASSLGAYTLLDLQWLSADTAFGINPDGQPNRVAPLPNADSNRLWSTLATRYQNESAVLYDIFNEPHDPMDNDPNVLQGIREDGSLFTITTRKVTTAEWQPWARQLIRAIRGVHANSLVFVSGIDWAYDLRGMPLTIAPDSPETFPNLVYSTHVYKWKGPPVSPGTLRGLLHSISTMLGISTTPNWQEAFGDLAARVPVFAGEWGGENSEQDLAWGEALGTYLNNLGMGWTAWSWSDWPYLVRNGQPTGFGLLVRRYLSPPAA